MWGGRNVENGFTDAGNVLLGREDDIKSISKEMKELVAKCGCKGSCNTGQCSCVKRDMNCVGCECGPSRCPDTITKVGPMFQNPITHTEVTEEVDDRRDEGMGNWTEDDDEDGRVQLGDFLNTCTSGDDHYDEEGMLYLLEKYF